MNEIRIVENVPTRFYLLLYRVVTEPNVKLDLKRINAGTVRILTNVPLARVS